MVDLGNTTGLRQADSHTVVVVYCVTRREMRISPESHLPSKKSLPPPLGFSLLEDKQAKWFVVIQKREDWRCVCALPCPFSLTSCLAKEVCWYMHAPLLALLFFKTAPLCAKRKPAHGQEWENSWQDQTHTHTLPAQLGLPEVEEGQSAPYLFQEERTLWCLASV